MPEEALLLRKCSFRPLMERSSWLERIWKYTFMKSAQAVDGGGDGAENHKSVEGMDQCTANEKAGLPGG